MRHGRVYLDHNASSPLRPGVVEAVSQAGACGNASSVHAEGRRARAVIDAARASVAGLLDALPSGIVFTGSGTEANISVLRPGALVTPGGEPVTRLIVGATEHPSVLSGHGFGAANVAVAHVDRNGPIDLDHLDALLSASAGPTLVSIQVANGETGVLQDVASLARLARRHGAAIHADAVQAVGRVQVGLATLGVDALTASAHKLGGPMGVGVLAVDPARVGPKAALLGGGTQERGFRAGTENVPGIVGFGVAAEEAMQSLAAEAPRLRRLREATEAEVRRLAPDVQILGAGAERLPNTVAFSVPGVAAETALIALDLEGVAVSSGSACSSGKVGRSHVLAAMGVPAPLAAGALRISLGWTSTQQEVNRFAAAFASVLQRLYEVGRARAA